MTYVVNLGSFFYVSDCLDVEKLIFPWIETLPQFFIPNCYFLFLYIKIIIIINKIKWSFSIEVTVNRVRV